MACALCFNQNQLRDRPPWNAVLMLRVEFIHSNVSFAGVFHRGIHLFKRPIKSCDQSPHVFFYVTFFWFLFSVFVLPSPVLHWVTTV